MRFLFFFKKVKRSGDELNLSEGNGVLAPVVQTLDNAIHWINHYPLDNSIGFASVYPLDSDLSGGQRYPLFDQLGPGRVHLDWILK